MSLVIVNPRAVYPSDTLVHTPPLSALAAVGEGIAYCDTPDAEKLPIYLKTSEFVRGHFTRVHSTDLTAHNLFSANFHHLETYDPTIISAAHLVPSDDANLASPIAGLTVGHSGVVRFDTAFDSNLRVHLNTGDLLIAPITKVYDRGTTSDKLFAVDVSSLKEQLDTEISDAIHDLQDRLRDHIAANDAEHAEFHALISELQQQYTDQAQQLSAEAQARARAQGDQALQDAVALKADKTALAAEVSAREAGDTDLANALQAERAEREAGDATNATAITALETQLQAESEAREMSDTQLESLAPRP